MSHQLLNFINTPASLLSIVDWIDRNAVTLESLLIL